MSKKVSMKYVGYNARQDKSNYFSNNFKKGHEGEVITTEEHQKSILYRTMKHKGHTLKIFASPDGYYYSNFDSRKRYTHTDAENYGKADIFKVNQLNKNK